MLQPQDEAELAACLAGSEGAVEILGAGSKRDIGGVVEATPLSTAAFTGIIDYRPEELVITARAATPLDELTRTLASSGQRLAFEPGALPGATHAAQTIGGVLATNLAGSRRVTAGAARDHFLGLRAVNGQGLTFKAGGKVVKNVTGYDLPKLIAGSWGTLAVMTEVTLRAVPAAEHECTWVVGEPDVASAVARMGRALGSTHDVSSAAFDPSTGGVALLAEASPASVAARLAALRAEATAAERVREIDVLEGERSRSFWTATGSAAVLGDASVVWRLSVPPSEAPRVIDALAPARYLLDWGGGLIWLAGNTVDAARVRRAVREGHATLVKAPAATRAAAGVFHPQTSAVASLAARVKAAFDPQGRLNPGRMR